MGEQHMQLDHAVSCNRRNTALQLYGETKGMGKTWAGKAGWAAQSAWIIHMDMWFLCPWQFSEMQWKLFMENHAMS